MNKVIKWPKARKIVIETYEDNTVYSVHIIDSYGTEHYIGNLDVGNISGLEVNDRSIASYAHQIWVNEVEPEENLLSNAIGRCIEIDEENGLEPNLD